MTPSGQEPAAYETTGDMAVAAHPSAISCLWTLVHSTPVSLRQALSSKSPCLSLAQTPCPGIAFPLPCGFYRGSLGPWFPTPLNQGCPRSGGTVRCYDCLRPSRSVHFRSLPVPWVDAFAFVSLPTRAGVGSSAGCVGQRHAWVLFLPVTLAPAVLPKETGGSPEFPGYPSEHMPRSQTPVVSRSLAIAQAGLLPSNRCRLSALGPVTRSYPGDHHYTFFGVQ
jgi:hypothetical protein